MKWTNMTKPQLKVLTMCEKLAKIEGLAIGMCYAAMSTDNTEAMRMAWDLKGDVKFVLDGILELADGQGNDEAEAQKLRIATDALRKLARLGNGDTPGNSDGNVLAQQCLRALGVDV